MVVVHYLLSLSLSCTNMNLPLHPASSVPGSIKSYEREGGDRERGGNEEKLMTGQAFVIISF